MIQNPVQTRQIFYIPGYDPIHPRRYRELYRREAAKQAALSGYEIGIAPRAGTHYGWQIAARIDGASVTSNMSVLVWSDIVRASMKTGIAATYLQLVQTAWTYLASGTLRRLMWLRKGPVIAALYPVVMLLAQLGLAIIAGAVVAGLLSWAAAGLVGRFDGVIGWIGLAVKWAILLAVAGLVLRGFRRLDHKLYAYYLMHDYAYSAKANGATPPELAGRLAEFEAAIAQALTQPVDEVLVIGHSSGAHLAVSILASLIRSNKVPPGGPSLSFLSLGHVIPMISFLPKGNQLRADLHLLSKTDRLAWIDVTAPGDGCSFALCDPVAVSGVAPETGKTWPVVLSAAFTQTLKDDTWAKLRWRFFRLHFQYLCAFDNLKGKSDEYDYFAITGGTLRLGERLGGRKPSQSRIDIAASRYTDMAA